MMTVVLTEENVTKALKEIIEQYGDDHVYVPPILPTESGETCVYVEEGPEGPKPSCIVAQVLHRLGVPVSSLTYWEGVGILTLDVEGKLFRVDTRLRRKLADLQYAQDMSVAWGPAARKAGFRIEGNDS
jgi:hypothetical protein